MQTANFKSSGTEEVRAGEISMTNTPEQPSRLDRIEALAISNTEAIAGLTSKIDTLTERVTELTYNVNSLTNDVTRVLGRSAILDDVLLELRENTEILQRSFEQHQQNFDENQRTTNAALNQMNAILLQLTRIDPPN